MKRLPSTQAAYRDFLLTNPDLANIFSSAPALKEFTHWKIIENNFPYDEFAETHHMFIPKRRVGKFRELTLEERDEYHKIIEDELEGKYDAFVINTPPMRTIPLWWHLHLIVWKKDSFI